MPICKEERIIQVFKYARFILILQPLVFKFGRAFRHQDAAMNWNAY